MSTAGARGGASVAGEEEMEDHAEMLAAGCTVIAGTADATVTEARHSTKRHRVAEDASEDLLNLHIQEYGLVSPERAKNVAWCFFRKYNCKKLQGRHDNLKLTQYALCTICLADPTRRLHCTVKMGKDNSPSSLLDHMRIYHLEEFNAVVLATNKGVSLATFTAHRRESRVRELIGNSVRNANSYGTRICSDDAGRMGGHYN